MTQQQKPNADSIGDSSPNKTCRGCAKGLGHRRWAAWSSAQSLAGKPVLKMQEPRRRTWMASGQEAHSEAFLWCSGGRRNSPSWPAVSWCRMPHPEGVSELVQIIPAPLSSKSRGDLNWALGGANRSRRGLMLLGPKARRKNTESQLRRRVPVPKS